MKSYLLNTEQIKNILRVSVVQNIATKARELTRKEFAADEHKYTQIK